MKNNKPKINSTLAVVGLSFLLSGGLYFYQNNILKTDNTSGTTQEVPTGDVNGTTVTQLFQTYQFSAWSIYSPYKTDIVRLEPQGVYISPNSTIYSYPSYWSATTNPNPELGDPGYTYLKSFDFSTSGPKLNSKLGYNATTHLYTGAFKSVNFEYNVTWKPCWVFEFTPDQLATAGTYTATYDNTVGFNFYKLKPTQVKPMLPVALTSATGTFLQTYAPATKTNKPNLSKTASFPVTKSITIDPRYSPECMLPGSEITHTYKVSLTKTELNKFAPLSTVVIMPSVDRNPVRYPDNSGSFANPSAMADIHVNFVKVSVVK